MAYDVMYLFTCIQITHRIILWYIFRVMARSRGRHMYAIVFIYLNTESFHGRLSS